MPILMLMLLIPSLFLSLSLSLALPSALALPLSPPLSRLLAAHHPALPVADVPSVLYRHDPRNAILHHLAHPSATSAHHIHIRRLRTTTHTPPRIPGVPHPPLIKRSSHHTFAYDGSSPTTLLSVWAPNLHLIPLPPPHRNLYFNIISSPQPHPLLRQSQSQSQPPPPRRHAFTSELPIFFDVAFAHDASFCKLYGNNGSRARQVIYSAAVAAHQMAFASIVSVRIAFITGSCSGRASSDPYRRPNGVCDASASCAALNPPAILRAFADAWRKEQRTPPADVDVAYLVTGYGAGPFSSVVGAAFVGAACNVRFGYGWMQLAHPVVIAHEMAHSLGAPHDSQGQLMKAVLDLDRSRAVLSERSKRHIQAYVDTAAHTCLSTRHAYTQRGNARFSAFVRINRNQFAEGSDIDWYDTRADSSAFLVVNVFKEQASKQQLFLYAGVVRRGVNAAQNGKGMRESVFPFAMTFNVTGHVVSGSTLDHRSGAGVAVAPLSGRALPDVAVVFMRNATHATYKVGFSFRASSGFQRGWSPSYDIPVALGNDIACLGATFRRSVVTPSSPSPRFDLVVAFVARTASSATHHVPFVIIGHRVSGAGAAASWSARIRVNAGFTARRVADISPVFLDGGSKLLLAYTQLATNRKWQQRFSLGVPRANKLNNNNDQWVFKTLRADLAYMDEEGAQIVTGGFAVVSFPGSKTETGIVYHSRQFASGNTQWVEVGDDMLARFKERARRVAGADMLTPFDMCAVCYGRGAPERACQQRFKGCFARRSSYSLSQVSAAQLGPLSSSSWRMSSSSSSSNSSSSSGPRLKTDSIFCTGFDAIYMRASSSAGGSACGRNPNEIWSAGVQDVLQSSMTQSGAVRVQGSSKTSFGKASGSEWFVDLGGTAGPSRQPVAVLITVFSPRFIRRVVVNRAVSKLKLRSDFSTLFRPTPAAGRVRRVAGNKFLVNLLFKRRFQFEFFRTLQAAHSNNRR